MRISEATLCEVTPQDLTRFGSRAPGLHEKWEQGLREYDFWPYGRSMRGGPGHA